MQKIEFDSYYVVVLHPWEMNQSCDQIESQISSIIRSNGIKGTGPMKLSNRQDSTAK